MHCNIDDISIDSGYDDIPDLLGCKTLLDGMLNGTMTVEQVSQSPHIEPRMKLRVPERIIAKF